MSKQRRKSKVIDIILKQNLWTLTFVKAIFEAVLKGYTRNRYLHDKQPRQNVKSKLLLFIGSPELLSALLYISASGKKVERYASIQR